MLGDQQTMNWSSSIEKIENNHGYTTCFYGRFKLDQKPDQKVIDIIGNLHNGSGREIDRVYNIKLDGKK